MNVDTVGQAAAAAADTPAAAPAFAPRQAQQQRVVAPAGAPLMSTFFSFLFLFGCVSFFFTSFLLCGRSLKRALGFPGGGKAERGRVFFQRRAGEKVIDCF